MKIVQSTLGVFHHFELAREMLRRGHLDSIYSTFPWQRLKREGIPRARVETFPWVHTTELLLPRLIELPTPRRHRLTRFTYASFDRWIARRIPECDALIALTGSALEAGRLVQSRGGIFISDRGSTHRRFQAEIVAEEYRRWNLPHIPEDPFDMAREDELYGCSDHIVVPSQAARRTFLDRGFDPERIHVIPYGVLLERFSPVAAPPSDTFEVLFVGAVTLRKGIPYLLQAFAAFDHPHKRLRIVGSLDPALKPLLAALPQAHVEFLGPVPQLELPALMSSSHVMVVPSIEDGFGLVVPQAMACGCPVIVSDQAGAADIVEEGISGFVVPARSPQHIAERLQRLADDPQLRDRMSAAALARVQHIGGWRQYGDQWESLLTSVIAPSRPSKNVVSPNSSVR
jgi:starch synthase